MALEAACFEVLPYEGSLEMIKGLVVPQGSVVMDGIADPPWRPWPTPESANQLMKMLLGIRKKKAAPEPEEEAAPAVESDSSDESDESGDASDEDEEEEVQSDSD